MSTTKLLLLSHLSLFARSNSFINPCPLFATRRTETSSVGILGMSSSLSSENNEKKQSAPPEHVVIAGAGMIGTATAYYLAKEFGVSSTLVDPSGEIAPAASGKAGGFLALDWNDYASVGPLARRSFGLHQEIADSLGAESIQYRRLTCASISVGDGGNRLPGGKKLEGIEWAEGTGLTGVRSLGNEETIAQVHPKRLCEALFRETQKLTPKTNLVRGKVVSAVFSSGQNKKEVLAGAEIDDGSTIKGDALVYACGPWTADVMFGIKYHSVVVPTPKVLSQCVFFSGCGDPEVYVRPDRTAYCTGFPDAPVRVTEQPGKEEVRSDAIQKIETAVREASKLSSSAAASEEEESAALSSKTKTIKQACYLPATQDNLPIMGELKDQPNCYVAAGHSCWGILMGPATGESMAHIIATGKSPHVNLSSFSPSRFGKFQLVP